MPESDEDDLNEDAQTIRCCIPGQACRSVADPGLCRTLASPDEPAAEPSTARPLLIDEPIEEQAQRLGLKQHVLRFGSCEDLTSAISAVTTYRCELLSSSAPNAAEFALVFRRGQFFSLGAELSPGETVTGTVFPQLHEGMLVVHFIDGVMEGAPL